MLSTTAPTWFGQVTEDHMALLFVLLDVPTFSSLSQIALSCTIIVYSQSRSQETSCSRKTKKIQGNNTVQWGGGNMYLLALRIAAPGISSAMIARCIVCLDHWCCLPRKECVALFVFANSNNINLMFELTSLLFIPFHFRAADPAQSRLGQPLKVCHNM